MVLRCCEGQEQLRRFGKQRVFNTGVGIITNCIPLGSLYSYTIMTPPKPYSDYSGPGSRVEGVCLELPMAGEGVLSALIQVDQGNFLPPLSSNRPGTRASKP